MVTHTGPSTWMGIQLSNYRNIVILTGAGVSAGSGLPTYRGTGGFWLEHNVAEYGTVEALHQSPEKVWGLFGPLRAAIRQAQPNAAHLSLARVEGLLNADQKFRLVTQNVDGLHQRAGSRAVVELHGDLRTSRCMDESCRFPPFADEADHAAATPQCPVCTKTLRPGIVLFGEPIPALASWTAKRALRDCDLFIAVGTSGMASPAADMVRSAAYAGARTVLVNLEPADRDNPAYQEKYYGPAEVLLPQLLEV